jgi:hypothetical protein
MLYQCAVSNVLLSHCHIYSHVSLSHIIDVLFALQVNSYIGPLKLFIIIEDTPLKKPNPSG